MTLYRLRRAHGRLRRFANARRLVIPEQPTEHLPDFLVIGAPRSGTTWLLRNLTCHPDVFMVPQEIHFLDRYYRRGWAWYAAHFVDGAGRIRGEKTPAYAHQPQARIDAASEHMPAARLVYMLRNPIDRAWSEVLNQLVKKRRRPPEAVRTDAFLRFLHRSDGWRERGAYLANLERWQRSFSADQILVTFYDDVAERPEALLSGILEHIGARSDQDWSQYPFRARVNPTPDAPMPIEVREYLTAFYRDDLERLADSFGAPARRWLVA